MSAGEAMSSSAVSVLPPNGSRPPAFCFAVAIIFGTCCETVLETDEAALLAKSGALG